MYNVLLLIYNTVAYLSPDSRYFLINTYKDTQNYWYSVLYYS